MRGEIDLSDLLSLVYLDLAYCEEFNSYLKALPPKVRYLNMRTDSSQLWVQHVEQCANTLEALVLARPQYQSSTPQMAINCPNLRFLSIHAPELMLHVIAPNLSFFEVPPSSAVHLGHIEGIIHLRVGNLDGIHMYSSLRILQVFSHEPEHQLNGVLQVLQVLEDDLNALPELKIVEFGISDASNIPMHILSRLEVRNEKAGSHIRFYFITKWVTGLPMESYECAKDMPCQ
ncbi:hypothetical protein M408DRAFT_26315 [Serendipita vermifera MAFF 305830]|uniref:F-box domain-containing protein n=1 Tax=Serendipita vermifera MAFF 305830 TaxID=933852 RepID=A0A0C2WFX9_SERVB|nr:hypothetical protein M408DRAFT_26315 [Serendipita vermifera MAFF 305830]